MACGCTATQLTAANVPVMTRLRFDERATLDTLIDAGVARSGSKALAWCVRLVADNEDKWISQIREAMPAVDEARRNGPASRSSK